MRNPGGTASFLKSKKTGLRLQKNNGKSGNAGYIRCCGVFRRGKKMRRGISEKKRGVRGGARGQKGGCLWTRSLDA